MAKEYVVEWSVDVVADSPEAAAKAAWDMMRDPDSTANVFDVIPADGSGEAVRVDLQEVLEEEACVLHDCALALHHDSHIHCNAPHRCGVDHAS